MKLKLGSHRHGKNATETKVNIVNDNESKERTRILGEIGQRRDAGSHDTVIISKANETTNGGNAVILLASIVDIETKLKCSKYVDISIKEVQQAHFMKSSGKSKEVEALIGSLTSQEVKYYNAKTIRTLRDINIGDIVKLKTGINPTYGNNTSVKTGKSIGKIAAIRSRDCIIVNFPEFGRFKCTLDEIYFAI